MGTQLSLKDTFICSAETTQCSVQEDKKKPQIDELRLLISTPSNPSLPLWEKREVCEGTRPNRQVRSQKSDRRCVIELRTCRTMPGEDPSTALDQFSSCSHSSLLLFWRDLLYFGRNFQSHEERLTPAFRWDYIICNLFKPRYVATAPTSSPDLVSQPAAEGQRVLGGRTSTNVADAGRRAANYQPK